MKACHDDPVCRLSKKGRAPAGIDHGEDPRPTPNDVYYTSTRWTTFFYASIMRRKRVLGRVMM